MSSEMAKSRFCIACHDLLQSIRVDAQRGVLPVEFPDRDTCPRHHRSLDAFLLAVNEGCALCRRLERHVFDPTWSIESVPSLALGTRASWSLSGGDSQTDAGLPGGTVSLCLSFNLPQEMFVNSDFLMELVPVVSREGILKPNLYLHCLFWLTRASKIDCDWQAIYLLISLDHLNASASRISGWKRAEITTLLVSAHCTWATMAGSRAG